MGRVLLGLGVVALAGCASVPTPDFLGGPDGPVEAHETRRAELLGVSDWTAAGRIAVRAGDESWSARVNWTQRGESYRLRLSGPLGQGAAQLLVRPGAVELRTADDRRYTAETPEELLQTHVGWSIPLAGLRYWLMGVADPSVDPSLVDIDSDGLLTRLEQSGWSITYDRYQTHGTLPMPARMQFESPRLTGKVAVSTWELALDTAMR